MEKKRNRRNMWDVCGFRSISARSFASQIGSQRRTRSECRQGSSGRPRSSGAAAAKCRDLVRVVLILSQPQTFSRVWRKVIDTPGIFDEEGKAA